ncbi:MAG: stage II sporulation protein R [Firmicutes bacterium]|nr:stage II sporulation protein R [Bacillota bacterium]
MNFLRNFHIKNIYLKNKRLLTFALIFGIFFAGAKGYSNMREEEIKKGIAQNVLRFHVLAPGNSPEEQALKLKVRDEVIAFLRPKFKETKDISSAVSLASSLLEETEAIANETLIREGYNRGAKVNITKEDYPQKKYGQAFFPEGEYFSLRIVIGEGKGENWWCVMYPPLCFTDAAFSGVSKEDLLLLRGALNEEEYLFVTGQNKPEIKLWILEALKNAWNIN